MGSAGGRSLQDFGEGRGWSFAFICVSLARAGPLHSSGGGTMGEGPLCWESWGGESWGGKG